MVPIFLDRSITVRVGSFDGNGPLDQLGNAGAQGLFLSVYFFFDFSISQMQ